MKGAVPETDGVVALVRMRGESFDGGDGGEWVQGFQKALDWLPTQHRYQPGGTRPDLFSGTRRVRITVQRGATSTWLLARDAGPYPATTEPPC